MVSWHKGSNAPLIQEADPPSRSSTWNSRWWIKMVPMKKKKNHVERVSKIDRERERETVRKKKRENEVQRHKRKTFEELGSL